MKAIIFGVTGQDGSYLSELLLEKGYKVLGVIRRASIDNTARLKTLKENKDFSLIEGDVTDFISVSSIINDFQPDEVYNLAAMSHVRISTDMPAFTIKTNSLGVLNMLEVVRTVVPKARFYQASSSEMFGNSIEPGGMQTLTTPMHPVSPYGCSKVLGYNLVRHYRNGFKMHACNGILFNHESPRRGTNFVTNKVVKTAVQIKKGMVDKLELGNMDSCRDWGHSYDYVRGMHKIINHEVPDDFIIATGDTYSVRDMCDHVFSRLDMDYKDYVVQNPKYMRPEELKYLRGDSSKIRETLGWEPTYTFASMLDEMIEYWMEKI